MEAIIDLIANLLEIFLPEPWNHYMAQVLVVLAAALAVYLIVRRFFLRHKLYVNVFSMRSEQDRLNGSQFAQALIRDIKQIQRIHSESVLTGAGDVTAINDLKHVNEDLESQFDAFVEATVALNPVASLLLSFANIIWPRLELQGDLLVQEGEIICSARLVRGKKQLDLWVVREKEQLSGAMTKLADALAYQIVLNIANKRLINKSSSIGTSEWRAFKAHTEALDRWQSPAFDSNKPEDVSYVDRRLLSSVHYDPDYAMVHYNRGILIYLTHQGAQTNEMAMQHFQRAITCVQSANSQRSSPGNIEARRVEGLAWLGLARCYCQNRHRYGYTDPEVVHLARAAAGRAVELLGRNAKSLHVQAFAWHCTETLEDIRKGRAIYEQIIKKEPRKYAVVYNNLGYILMVGGKLLMDVGERREAEEWYEAAQQHMETVFEIGNLSMRLIDFSHANLGNLYRLRGDYDRAIESYRKALRPDPERSSYTNGLNELSLVYFDMGELSSAVHYHELALRSTQDRSHQLKLIGQVVDVLVDQRHPAAHAVSTLYDTFRAAEGAADLPAWLTQLAAQLSPHSAPIQSVAVEV